jgi:hypothetical protein
LKNKASPHTQNITLKSSTQKSLLHKIVHRSLSPSACWLAAAVYFSLALAAQAVSPSMIAMAPPYFFVFFAPFAVNFPT